MSTISKPTTFSDNTTAEASEVNANFDTIYNDYNGGISAVNLAASAISTAKIADSAVTTAKIAAANVTYSLLSANLILGWIDANETWTYASGTGTNVGTFTVAGIDLTGKYQAGDRLQFTQTTVKYAVITKVAFSTNTTVTIYMGTDYTIANAAITSNYYSRQKGPFGFPIDPAKWTVTATSSSDRNTTSTSYATLTDAITVPIGAWDLRLKACLEITTDAATNTRFASITLSSDASTETNSKTTLTVISKAGTAAATGSGATQNSSEHISIASQTTYTIMGKTGAGTLNLFGSSGTATLIRAVCSYI